jgi:hypothetical protein
MLLSNEIEMFKVILDSEIQLLQARVDSLRKFRESVDELEPRRPSTRATDQSAIELLRRLRVGFNGCDDTYIKPLLREVDAVLKAADGG